MGRWAQRTRRGGGPPINPTAIEIISIQVPNNDTAIVQFSGSVNVADFGLSDLRDRNNGAEPGIKTQTNATTLTFTSWDDLISPGEIFDLITTAPGVVSPQSHVST